MQRVLVTGLSGFTGRYLQAELRQHGFEVWGLSSHASPATGDAPGAQRHLQADLADAAGVRHAVAQIRPQAVVHLAAVAFVAHGDAEAFYRTNLLGTRHLLAALADMPGPPCRVLLASSANVYGNAAQGELDENSPVQPANDYAVSKLAMEHMARLWHERLPLTIVRPFNYTGAGQSRQYLLGKIVDHFRRRAPVIELGNLDVWRDFSDVRAVAQAYRRLLQTPAAAGQTVNICSGRTSSLREIIALASELTDHAIQVQVNPAFVRASEVRCLSGSPARLRSLIGADWHSPPLRDTLRWMLSAPPAAAAQ